MPATTTRHDLRPIRFERMLESQGWRLKTYSIVHGAKPLDPRLMSAAETLAGRTLVRFPGSSKDARLGYVGIHQGNGANVIFFGLWTNENEMRHVSYWGTGWDADDLEMAEVGDPVVCVWDLSLMAHERDAWVDHMLAPMDGPDAEAYLEDRMDALA